MSRRVRRRRFFPFPFSGYPVFALDAVLTPRKNLLRLGYRNKNLNASQAPKPKTERFALASLAPQRRRPTKDPNTTVSLIQGEKATLGLAATKLRVGLGWNPRVNVGEDFDLDVSCFLLGEDDQVRSKDDLVFYNRLESPRGSVKHTGDNESGEGAGDDEAILVDLSLVPDDVAKLVFVATIHKARERRQNFGIVDDAYMRVVDRDTNEELARFDLSEDACVEHSLIFGALVKKADGWQFRAIGKGVETELPEIARSLGF